jgi:hypothetical protein
MSGRYSPSTVKNFPPLLRRLVRAAQTECPEGHAEALVVFIGLALRKEPPRGIFDPRAKVELNAAIQSIARAHFEVDEALVAWRRALTAATSSSKDPDPPHSGFPQQTDCAASFYAGLAFGLVFAGPCAIVP